MKFTVEQSALADGVNWVSRSLSTRPIMTALLGIVIDASGDEVFLSGSDLETSSKAHFAADIKEKGKVLVPGRLLAEITRSLPNKPISISLDGSRVLVTSGSAKFTLPTLSLTDYPNLPELPEPTGVIASDTFANAVAQVAMFQQQHYFVHGQLLTQPNHLLVQKMFQFHSHRVQAMIVSQGFQEMAKQ
jgi:DNA polymerase-3 subunit beta